MSLLKEQISHAQTKGTTITPQEARQIMDSTDKYVLLDVRSPSEYKQKHINGSKLIPVAELNTRVATELPDKHIPVFVYCQSGTRASRVVKTLREMGYTNVLSIGGIMNWPYETVRE